MDYIIKLKRKKINLFRDRWIWKLAWHDARHNFSRLFLFISSIVIGIAALVAINAFNLNLQGDINTQAKELLGADIKIDSDEKGFDENFTRLIDSLGLITAQDAQFASMVYFPKNEGTRLIRVKAIKGNFPFYGKVGVRPGSDLIAFYEGKGAMIDENLALQFNIQMGDSLQLGQTGFKVISIITRFPGNTNISTSFAPSVYIPYDRLPDTRLIQYGSRVDYNMYVKLENKDPENVLETLQPLMEKNDFHYETADSEKEDLGRSFSNLYKFFNLLSFVALILGSIGVASSVHIYVREKREIAATLRCLGASGWQVFYVFFWQVFVLGFIGTLIGIIHGILIQYLLPWVVKDFLPISVDIHFTIIPVIQGLLVGMIMAILFAMLPLSGIRLVSPLIILRSTIEPIRKISRFRYLIIGGILLFPWLFAVNQTSSWLYGSAFFGSLLITFGLLWVVGISIIRLTRRFFPKKFGFVWRQSLANMFRPNNQTIMLVVVIGLGAFLLSNMTLIQNSLLGQVEFAGAGKRSNTILFDIQPDQKDDLIKFTKNQDVPVQQLVPVVTTRLKSLKGKSVDAWKKDTTDHISHWALTREYRVTYRDSLIESEKLIKGKLQRYVLNPDRDSIFISIGDGMAHRLNVDLKDQLVFDVQGVPVVTYVGSIREIDWRRVQTNFWVLFPDGVLEDAPQFYVLISRINSREKSASFQQKLVEKYPNVSMIDLTLILVTLRDIFDKVETVIRFMALFSVLTGLIVLTGAVINSKYARLKENVLLRTLGALKKQLRALTLIEYGYLGIFASLAGSLLAILSSWILARYFFEIKFYPDFLSIAMIWLIVTLLTMVVGWFNTRSVINKSPLEVLRREV